MTAPPTGPLAGAPAPRPRRRPPTGPVFVHRYTPADPLVGLVALLGLGSVAIAGFVVTGEPVGLLVGLPSVLLVVVVCVRWALRARNLPRLPAIRIGRIRGELWTVVPSEPSERLVQLTILLLLVAPFLAGAALVVVDEPVVGALLLLVPLSAARAIVRTARGDAAATLALRADRLLYQRDGLRSVVRWEDVTMVLPSAGPESVLLRTTRDAVVRSGTRSRLARASLSAHGVLLVTTQDLALDGPAVAAVLAHYAGSPAERAALGTPSSLAVIDRVAAGAGAGPGPVAPEPVRRVLPDGLSVRPVRRQAGEPGGAVGLLLAVLAIVLGLGLVLSSQTSGTDNTWLGGLIAAAGLGSVAAQALRRVPRPPPPPTLGTTRRGARTIIRRDTRRFWAGFAPYLLPAAVCSVWALAAWPAEVALGSLVILGVLVLAGPVGVLSLGLLTAGSLELDETGLVYRSRGQRSRIRWDELSDVWGRAGAVDLSARSGTWFKHLNTPGLWSSEIALDPHQATVATDGTVLDGPGAAQLLHAYAQSAERRRELGTEASLRRIASIALVGGDRGHVAEAPKIIDPITRW